MLKKNALILALFAVSCEIFSFDLDFRINCSKMEHKNENPFRDLDDSYFKENLRREKIVIAAGVITMAAGIPLLLAGVLPLVSPNTDIPQSSVTTYYVLTGVGGGLLAAGTGVTIAGAVAFGIGRKKIQLGVSFR